MNKTFGLLMFFLVFTLAACDTDSNTRYTDSNSYDDTYTTEDTDDMLYLTLEELSQYDGRDGASAYIAVNGVIYDVSDSSQWPDGLHRGQHQAGQDLTDALTANTRHGDEMLDRIPKIGYLIDDE